MASRRNEESGGGSSGDEVDLRHKLLRQQKERKSRRAMEDEIDRRLQAFKEEVVAAVVAATSSTAGPKRPRSGRSSSRQARRSEESDAEAEASSASKRGRLDVLKAQGVVPAFNPDRDDDKSIDSAEEWLAFVEQLGRVHGWTDEEKVLLLHMKMEGEARRWFRQHLSEDLLWRQWRRALLEAFPRRYEYHAQLTEVSKRSKQPGETYSAYYRSVTRMCEQMGATTAQTVSCLIGGLPSHLQANADSLECTTPLELYNRLLAKLDARAAAKKETPRPPGSEARGSHESRSDSRGGHLQRSRESRSQTDTRRAQGGIRSDARADPRGGQGGSGGGPKPSRSAASEEEMRCFNCQKKGHIGRNCPLRRVDDACRYCKEPGHFMRDCPKKRRQESRSERGRVSGIHRSVPDYHKWGVMPNGEPVAVYIDTGSEANILDPRSLRRLGLRSQPTSARLSGFGGGRAVADQEVRFTLIMDGCQLDVEAIVAPLHLEKVDLLLGQPILNGGSVLLEVQGDKVRLTRVEESFRRLDLGDEELGGVTATEEARQAEASAVRPTGKVRAKTILLTGRGQGVKSAEARGGTRCSEESGQELRGGIRGSEESGRELRGGIKGSEESGQETRGDASELEGSSQECSPAVPRWEAGDEETSEDRRRVFAEVRAREASLEKKQELGVVIVLQPTVLT